MSQQFAADYIDVATRIVEFREKHPDGCLQPADLTVPFRVENIGDQTFIIVVAAAYRTPDDPKPGVGMAYEVFPGRTPYTHGSELQNAETSAWGRAIVAALAADTKKGIASAEEVRNRQAERDLPRQARVPQQERNATCSAPEADPRVDLINAIAAAADTAGIDKGQVMNDWADGHSGQHIKNATDMDGLRKLLASIEGVGVPA